MPNEEDLRCLVAFLFQRSGRRSLSENELANAASLDLKWFAPKAARNLMAGLVRAGWLVRDEEGELEPAFDVKTVKVPMGFRPSTRLVDDVPPPGSYQGQEGTGDKAPAPAATVPERPGSAALAQTEMPTAPPEAAPATAQKGAEASTLLGDLLEALSSETGEAPGAWVAWMDQVVQRTDDGVLPEVALLLAASKHGIDVDRWIDEARQRLV